MGARSSRIAGTVATPAASGRQRPRLRDAEPRGDERKVGQRGVARRVESGDVVIAVGRGGGSVESLEAMGYTQRAVPAGLRAHGP